jgi:beta-lactamase superfamily II metal-dependent hydrolase
MNTANLRIIFIDVGWGDSILLDATDAKGNHEFALVDSNDSTNSPSGKNFLKRYFERLGRWPGAYPVFKYVFTTHAHDDHICGIQGVLRTFGTKSLFSSFCNPSTSLAFANLRRWALVAKSNHHRVATTVDYLWLNRKTLTLGPATIDVLWPPDCAGNAFDLGNENNNSLVLAFTLDKVRLVLTGDCEAKNFDVSSLADYVQMPKTGLRMVQSPHHGARNGIFDGAGTKSSFLDQIIPNPITKNRPLPLVGISCHPRPHHHPHSDVITELDLRGISQPYRTDKYYHLVFIAEDNQVTVEYSH